MFILTLTGGQTVVAFHEDNPDYTGCPGSNFQGPPSPNTDCPPEHEPGEYPEGWISEGSFSLGDRDRLNLPFVDVSEGSPLFANILNILFIIVGALSTIFIVVGGLRYVLSAGNPEAIQKAKNTVVYAVVGLVVSVLASIIVNFVVSVV